MHKHLYIQWGGKANKNGVWVENRPKTRVQPINLQINMIQANRQHLKELLNLHAFFVRLSSPMDIVFNIGRWIRTLFNAQVRLLLLYNRARRGLKPLSTYQSFIPPLLLLIGYLRLANY